MKAKTMTSGNNPRALESNAEIPAEDGVNTVGLTRIGYSYIFEIKETEPSGNELKFSYDEAGNQILREVISHA